MARRHDGIRAGRIDRGDWKVVEIVARHVARHVVDAEARAEKLRELATEPGCSPFALNLTACEPQFCAPARFPRPRRPRR